MAGLIARRLRSVKVSPVLAALTDTLNCQSRDFGHPSTPAGREYEIKTRMEESLCDVHRVPAVIYQSYAVFTFGRLQKLYPTNNSRAFATATEKAGKGSNASEAGRETGEDAMSPRLRILEGALDHVNRLGWSEAALAEAAAEAGLSPAVVGMFPRKEAELVEFFMDSCLSRTKEELARRQEELRQLTLRERISAAIRERLEQQAAFVTSWPQALSIQTQPSNAATSLRQRLELFDTLWAIAGDHSPEMERQAKRLMLATVYSTSEVYMLTDYSPGFDDTWKFLDRQVEAALDMKKSAQEALHIMQSVGVGLQNSVNNILRGVGTPHARGM
eukprot:TRINITY_DN6180_c0_g1_i1.p1 TRINITY_DN6180_c0_g1~~TRINITY_DN6180_c0_g1_i1.p1  ORF type:complete len:331 (-),score=44.35 TRINITY_DN6180_c0_g1_i1:497-1489(-)